MTNASTRTTYLTEILEKRRERIEQDFTGVSLENLRREAFKTREKAEPNRLRKALENDERTNVIAEFKRRSPSKGAISENANPQQIARLYFENGAAAISCLTEPDFFGGSFDDLKTVVETVGDKIPVLCKDFIVDERQIFQAANAGASAILLIVAAFSENETDRLKKLYSLATEIGLDVLVEVHTLEEMRVAEQTGAKIIGVNNRNLQTFAVSLETSVELIKRAPKDSILIRRKAVCARAKTFYVCEIRFQRFFGWRDFDEI